VLDRVLARQLDQQVFLGSEVLIQRADRVLALFGDARHLQVEQALAADQLARGLQDQLLPVTQLPLAALPCSHCDGFLFFF